MTSRSDEALRRAAPRVASYACHTVTRYRRARRVGWHAVRAAAIAALGLWLGIAAGLAQEEPPGAPEEAAPAAETPTAVEPGGELEPARPGEADEASEEGATRDEEHAGEEAAVAATAEAEQPEPSRPAPRPRRATTTQRRPSRAAVSQQLERRRNDIAKRGAEIERELAEARAKLADAEARLRTLERASRREPPAIRAGDRTSAEGAQLQADAQSASKDYLQLYADAQAGQQRATELLTEVESDLKQYAAVLSRSAFSEVQKQLGEQETNAGELADAWEGTAGVAVGGASVAARLSSAIVTAQRDAREHSPWRRARTWISTRTAAHVAQDLRLASVRVARFVTDDVPEWLGTFGGRLATAAGLASFALRLVACGLLIFAGMHGWRHLYGYASRQTQAADDEQPGELSAAAAATLGIARALIIFAVGAVVIWLCGFSGQWCRWLMSLLVIIAGAILLENVTERTLSPAEPERRIVPATDEHAVHLYRTFRSFLVFSAVLLPAVFGLRIFPYEHDDVVAAVDFVYGLGAWLYMFALLLPFGGLRALIPEKDTVASRMAQRTAVAVSTAVLVLGAVLLTVHAAGYTNLSQLLARTIPVAVLTIAVAWVLHRTYAFQIEPRLAAISVEDSESADWRVFLLAARPLLGLVERLGIIMLAGAVIVRAGALPQGRLRELSAVLSKPLFIVQDTEVSAWALVSAALVMVFSILISRVVRAMLQEAGSLRRQYDAGVRYAISSVVYYVLVVVAVLWGVRLAGFDLGALAVFAGVAGIGLAFGLQDIVKNFISGLILLIEQPIKVGDFIDMGDVRGLVTQISIRSTTVRTLGNVFVIVPNADFVTQRVLNLSHRDLKLRLEIDVGVSYDSDVESAREILRKVGEDHPLTLNDPSPDVRLMGFGDSSVDFRLLTWIADPRHQGRTTSELNFAVWRALQEHGIEIPFPQRDLHIRSDATLGEREPLRAERRDEAPPPSKDA